MPIVMLSGKVTATMMAGASMSAITATMCPPNVASCISRKEAAVTNVTVHTISVDRTLVAKPWPPLNPMTKRGIGLNARYWLTSAKIVGEHRTFFYFNSPRLLTNTFLISMALASLRS